ncbi:uncharacterized protein METZ01_LOCUS442163 [marine metagenome]|jgi:hypothetical protein|uniref:Uncharacterized protein n=1 Tax=marine metagenome TaxID=408172 RepID=A0A382Z2A4_9ZZZZ
MDRFFCDPQLDRHSEAFKDNTYTLEFYDFQPGLSEPPPQPLSQEKIDTVLSEHTDQKT